MATSDQADAKKSSGEPVEILLVDFSSIYWIAYHSSGAEDADAPARRSVGRVRGLAQTYPHVAVCIDTGRTWRHERSPLYKANREAKPEEARAGLRNAIERLRRDGFPIWGAEGFEADDVIASATKVARARGMNVTIASADKDLLQLVGPGVAMLSTREDGKIWGVDEVCEKFGVAPKQLGDWLAIVGDASDNVPGCPGVGPKGATKLLERFGTLEAVIAATRADEALLLWELRASQGEALEELGPKPETPFPPFTSKQKETLVANADGMRLSRELVGLRDDVPINLDEALRPRVAEKPSAPITFDRSPTDEDDMSDEEKSPESGETQKQEAAATPEAVAPAEQTQPATVAIAEFTEEKEPTAALVHSVEWTHSLEPRTLRNAMGVARALHESRLFGHFNSAHGIFAAILLARSHGIETMKVLMPGMVHNIKGKLSMSAQMMVGLVLRSGKCEYFDLVESSMTKAVYETKRVGGRRAVTLEYTIEEAKKLDNYKPESAWMKSTKAMLRHRCETELARAVYPDVVGGLYTREELEDIREAA